uniref:Uncharacterized protein n=1 Tax=viral metagenome TaxID=1070528 RepID=A0A6M3LD11_9ZZZZ
MPPHELLAAARADGCQVRLDDSGAPRLSGTAEAKARRAKELGAQREGVVAELQVEAEKAEAASLAEAVRHIDEAARLVWNEMTRTWTWEPEEEDDGE